MSALGAGADQTSLKAGGRAKVYGLAFAAFFAIVYLSAVTHSYWVSPEGAPLFIDFGIFWAVSHWIEHGQASLAYQSHLIGQGMAGFMGNATPVGFGWFYPPTYFFLIWPLGYLSPPWAYASFMLVTGLLYVSSVVKTLPSWSTFWLLMGFSGLWLNLMIGQNGFLSAGLLGWALIHLERRPVLAGALLALLSFKPHLGILIPVALLVARQWRCLASAALFSCLLAGASGMVFGWDAWFAWWHNFPLARFNLAQTDPHFLVKVTSVFSWARLQGMAEGWAYVLQGLCSLMVLIFLVQSWRQAWTRETQYGILVLSALLVTPYVFEYDLTWLAVAAAWWVRSWGARPFLRAERFLLVLLWLMPGLTFLLGNWQPGLPVSQGVLLMVLAWFWYQRRQGIRL